MTRTPARTLVTTAATVLLAIAPEVLAAPLSVSTVPATNIVGTSAQLNGAANPNGLPTIGYFRLSATHPGTCNDTFGTRVPASDGTDLGSGGNSIPYAILVTSLVPGTRYYFCAIVTNADGTGFGDVLTFLVPGTPQVTTADATLVTTSSAVLNGSANPIADATTGWFRYSTTNPGTCNDTFGTRAPSSGGTQLGSGETAVNYTRSITGLLSNVTYYYCAIASNSLGTSFGTIHTFTTPPASPIVTTNTATDLTPSGATLRAFANPRGAATTGWFRYSTTSPGACNDAFGTRAPTSDGTSLGAGNGSIAFSAPVTGLSLATTYWVCAIAQNSEGLTFGALQTFTTAALPPTATTRPATNVQPTSVVLESGVNPNGSSTFAWLRYSTTNPGTCNDTFGTTTTSTSIGSGTVEQTHSRGVTGLLEATTYFYCVIASSTLGTRFGDVLSFTTPPAPPTVATNATTNITGSSATLRSTITPRAAETLAWFRYSTTNPGTCDDAFGTRVPASGGTNVGSGRAPVANSQAITGLTPATTYFACAIAENSEGKRFGSITSFTTPTVPLVSTQPATVVTGSSATLNGTATPNGAATTAWFRYSTTNPGTCDDTFGTRVGTTSMGSAWSASAYSAGITGLTPNTTYFACAIASSAEGLSFGHVTSFFTSGAPAVATLDATSITTNSALLSGSANPTGASTTGYFRYDTTHPGTCNDTFGMRAPSSSGSALGSGDTEVKFSRSVTGLLSNVTYYYCAIAQNSVGTSFGEILTFHTPPGPPIVATLTPFDITATTATLRGTVNPRGAEATAWYRYSASNPGACNDAFGTRAPASEGTVIPAGNASISFPIPISGLTLATTYWVCAIAQNSEGLTFGALHSFTTAALPPSVTTLAATNVTPNGATLESSINPNGASTSVWFRYATASPGVCNDAFGTFVTSASIGSGTTEQTHARGLTGLREATTYFYCVIASNSMGSRFGEVLSFTTPPGPPTVTTYSASSLTGHTAALQGSVNPRAAETTGWFRYSTTNPGVCDDAFGTRTPASGGVALGADRSPVPLTQSITGLSPGATYFYCAIAQNSEGKRFGSIATFVSPNLPTVTTTAADSIGGTSGRLNGSAIANGSPTTAWFRYSSTNPGACSDSFGTRIGGSSVGASFTSAPFSNTPSDLLPNTTYFYCAIAQNVVGTAFGAILSFTTAGAPVVTTTPATGITVSSAVLNSTTNPMSTATNTWFRYGTENPGTCSDNFGIRLSNVSAGSGDQPVNSARSVSGLLSNVTYWYCAIATNEVGTSFGELRTFTTLPGAPLVTTNTAASLTPSSATLRGSVNPRGSSTTAWFRYSLTYPGSCDDAFGTRTPSADGTVFAAGNGNFSFAEPITGLSLATTYWYCAIAQNSEGLSFGSLQTFTTSPVAPTATTVAATGVVSTGATLESRINPNGSNTTAWFRYATTSPGSCNDSFGTPTTLWSVGSGTSELPYARAIGGLLEGTTYFYCVIANSSEGASFGTVLSFTTPAAPPTPVTGTATQITTTSATLQGSVNPRGAATTAWFRYSTTNPGSCDDAFGTRLPASGGRSIAAGAAAVPYELDLADLNPGTTYYFCAIAENVMGKRFGSMGQFTTRIAPSTETLAASPVTATSATLNGRANPNGFSTSAWFRYSTTSPGTCNDTFGGRVPSGGGTSLGAGTTVANFSQPVSGLIPGTAYFFCAIAQNAGGMTFGEVFSFTTPPAGAPTVTTSSATEVAGASATLNGSANPRGGETAAWFRYDTTSPTTCNDTFGTRTPATGGTSLGSGNSVVTFATTLTGLTPNATYFYCAIAANSLGTGVGTVSSFTTTRIPPTATTLAATGVTNTGATLSGEAIPNNTASTGWFRFSTTNPGTCNDTFGTRTPASGGTALGSGSTAVPYESTLSGLAPGTTYFWCSIASNAAGTSFGAVRSFTTPASPTVLTADPSGTTHASATLVGVANPQNALTTGWLRYATTNPGTCNDTFGTRVPATGGAMLGSGDTPVEYSMTIAGLAPATTYFYCALASNTFGTSAGAVRSFTTTAAPSATTIAATAITATGATLNASANPRLSATSGWFRYGTTNPGACNDTFGTRVPASGGTALGNGSSAVPYSHAITTLEPGTTYFFCAIAANAVGTSFGTIESFTTPAAPLTTTLAASKITSSTATLNGRANPRAASTTGWFRYSTTNPGACNDTFGTRIPSMGGTALGSGTSEVAFSETLSGLLANTPVWFCAIAASAEGTSFGTLQSFTTSPTLPTPTTGPASAITGTTATLAGTVSPNNATSTAWFRYATTNPGTCTDSFGTRAPDNGGSAIGASDEAVPFTQTITGLTPATTYWYCAVASSAGGLAFGTMESFTTPAAPTAATSAATTVTSTSAILNGTANPRLSATTGWFRIATTNPVACNDSFGTRAPTSGGTGLGAGNTSSAFSEAITGLAPATTYWFCAIAANAEGTAFGTLGSFTTPAAPLVITDPATNVSASGATLAGRANPRLAATTGWFRFSPTNPGACSDAFGTRAPATGGIALGANDAVSSYSHAITGLAPATTYWYCAIGSNEVGTSFGTLESFTTPAAPLVTTAAATSISSTGATLNGSANPRLSATTGWFRYGTTNPGTCSDAFGTRAPASGGVALGTGDIASTYTQVLTGLEPGTRYWFCAIASNAVGTSAGAVASFTTPAAPIVTTAATTQVTGTSATLGGSANPRLSPTTGWFRYATTHPGSCNDTFGIRAPTIGGRSLGEGNEAVGYTHALTGLTPATTYYACAIASNSEGTSFGAIVSFTTPAAPLVQTNAATAITTRGATLHGTGTPRRSATTGWFRYATTNPGICDDTFGTRVPVSGGRNLGAGDNAVAFEETLSELAPGTTFHFCAIASNAEGTVFGELRTFTTPGAPIVTAVSATSITSTGATLVGSANPNHTATTGWFRFGTTNPGTCTSTFGTRAPATGGIDLGDGSTAVDFSRTLGTLTPGTTYWFCAVASNEVGTVHGPVSSFTTPAAPTVATEPATSVTSTSATLHGAADPNRRATTVWFRYDTTTPGLCNDTFGTRTPATGGTELGDGAASVEFSQSLVGLAAGTTYYYCAIASNEVGTSFGPVLSFTTTGAAVVTTLDATNVTSTTATLRATANPRLSRTLGWFRFATTRPTSCDDTFGTRAPATNGRDLGSGSAPVPYEQTITELTPATTYFACAIAVNDVGTSTGAIVSFTTPAAPLVQTNAATAITSTGATLHGIGTPRRSATTGWFRYATSNPGTCDDTFGTRLPVIGGSDLGAGDDAVAFEETLSGLAPGTTFHFCAIASNAEGTVFGELRTFTTPGAPIVTAVSTTSITSTGATLVGSANPNRAATTAWFRFGTTDPGTCTSTFGTRAPATGGIDLGDGSTAVDFSRPLGTLTPGTTYWFCAVASNEVGTVHGPVSSFTTPAAPTVATEPATSVTSTSATLHGAAAPNRRATTAWFRYAPTDPGLCNDTFGTRTPAAGGTDLGDGAESVGFSQSLVGLAEGTTYYYCAIAVNEAGLSTGAIVSFTTPAAPLVTTSTATAVTDTSATLEGAANPRNAATLGWFRYSETDPGICDDAFGTRVPEEGGFQLGQGSEAVDFEAALEGLRAHTSYWYCAMAGNAEGTAFGTLQSFTTPRALPAVATVDADEIDATGARLRGEVNPNGEATRVWFRYDTVAPESCNDTFGTRTPDTDGVDVGSGSLAIAYDAALTGLQPGVTHYFCAIGSNALGTSFGELRTFTTSAAAPDVTTSPPTEMTLSTVRLHGSARPNGLATTAWFRVSTTPMEACDEAFGIRVPEAGGFDLGDGPSPVPFDERLEELTLATTYWFCAVAENAEGRSFGTVRTFTIGAPAPGVITGGTEDVSTTSATLTASIDANGTPTTAWFRFATTRPALCDDVFGTATPEVALEADVRAAPVSSTLADLSPGTEYFYCSIAANAGGATFGELRSFRTIGESPAVRTLAATVAARRVTLNGAANPNGTEATGWFRAGHTSPERCDDTFGSRFPVDGGIPLGDGRTEAPFTIEAGEFEPGTWFACALASNEDGTTSGEVVTFEVAEDSRIGGGCGCHSGFAGGGPLGIPLLLLLIALRKRRASTGLHA